MAMELVENMIRTGSIRRRSDRSMGTGTAEGVSHSLSIRSVSFRSHSLARRDGPKSDLGRTMVSTIQCNDPPKVDGVPNLDQISPICYDELYTSCEAPSSSSSSSDDTNAEEHTLNGTRTETQEKQDIPDELATDASSTYSAEETQPSLLPQPPMVVVRQIH
jgi:hypothetical protein